MVTEIQGDELRRAGENLINSLVVEVLPGSSDLGFPFENFDYTPRKYDHDLRAIANSIHQAWLTPSHPFITNPYSHTENSQLRKSRHIPEFIYLGHQASYDFAADLGEAMVITGVPSVTMKQHLGEGYYIASAALPLKRLWIKGQDNSFLDLAGLFPQSRGLTALTFSLAGWWHDNQTGDVLVSAPLRKPTREYPHKYTWDKVTGEYDPEALKWFFLHEKVHQYIAGTLPGKPRLNTDANCNALVAGVVEQISKLFPEEQFLNVGSFRQWVTWQKAHSNSYSE
jgi:hypothetical protein